MRQLGRNYLQEKRRELPETIGRTTLFVKMLLEKNGQGESYVFDPVSLVYLLPAAQDPEEETKKDPEEERVRDVILREKETVTLSTKEEGTREFFTRIIQRNTLPGAVEMLREKAWRTQLSIQLEILLKEYRELEQRHQLLFPVKHLEYLLEQGEYTDTYAQLIVRENEDFIQKNYIQKEHIQKDHIQKEHFQKEHFQKEQLYQAELRNLYQALREFREAYVILEQQVKVWKQETYVYKQEKQLHRDLEEQVERLYLCRQRLEEQAQQFYVCRQVLEKWTEEKLALETERLDKVILQAVEKQLSFFRAEEFSETHRVRSVQTEEQVEEQWLRTAEIRHRIQKDTLERTEYMQKKRVQNEYVQAERVENEHVQIEHVQTELEKESRMLQLVQHELQQLTREEVTELREELLRRWNYEQKERTRRTFQEFSVSEKWEHVQERVKEILYRIRVRCLEETVREIREKEEKSEVKTVSEMQASQEMIEPEQRERLLKILRELPQAEKLKLQEKLEVLKKKSVVSKQPEEAEQKELPEAEPELSQVILRTAEELVFKRNQQRNIQEQIQDQMETLRQSLDWNTYLDTEEIQSQRTLEFISQVEKAAEAEQILKQKQAEVQELQVLRVLRLLKGAEILENDSRQSRSLQQASSDFIEEQERQQPGITFSRELGLQQADQKNEGSGVSEESIQGLYREILLERTAEKTESEQFLNGQQLTKRPEIRELLKSREIQLSKEQKETIVELEHFQHHTENVEQIREEQKVQFQKLMERATQQEEQILRIENWQQELKELLQKQEEQQTAESREEQLLRKFQEQLRMERLRRGLI